MQRLSQRIQALESELSETQAKVQTFNQPPSSSDASVALAASAEEPGEIKDEGVAPAIEAAETGGEPQKALDELQAQFDRYKSEQSTKYEQGVMKVNSANVSHLRTKLDRPSAEQLVIILQVKLKQENQQWRGVRQHIETLQKEFKTPTQGGNFDLNTAIDEIVEVLKTERDKALATATEITAEKVKLEAALVAAKAEAAAIAATSTEVKSEDATKDSADEQKVSKERDELRHQIETLTTQCRASEEKAAKAAVKASMADKYKKDLTELRAKISSGQLVASTGATPPGPAAGAPTLSIKGESAAVPVTTASTDDAIDLGAVGGTPAAGRAARGARGTASRGATTRGVPRGTARGRGRGAANGARLDVQSVLAGKSQAENAI